MEIDIHKAFDSINREILIEKLRAILIEDEIRMVTYLLSNTKLSIRINGEYSLPFETTIGTPQGDALSTLLFIFYFDCIIENIPIQTHEQQTPTFLPQIVMLMIWILSQIV